jgi:hypothetical protein
MTTKKLASLLFAATMLAGCPKDDEGDTGASVSTTLGTMTTTNTTSDESTGGEGSGEGTSTTTTNGTTMTTSDSGPAESSSEGGGCQPTDECVEQSDCAPGEDCVACFCVGGAEESSDGGNPTMSDYGPCDACGPGEMPVSIQGFDMYCFCSPGCDGQGSACADPNEGTAMPVCALELMMGAGPSQCALICDPAMMGMCPTGAECIEVQMGVGVCMHPTG